MTKPFRFSTNCGLVELTGRRAHTLNELVVMLREAPGAAIFHHTYQTLLEYHMFIERYPNDFAEWIHHACGEEMLAERLASTNLKQHGSLAELRNHFVSIITTFIEEHPESRTLKARAPFYLCNSITVVTPTGDVAHTLDEFRSRISSASIGVIYHHFVTARLRLDLASNDFSAWLSGALKRHDLADRLDRIDLDVRTLKEVRSRIVECLS